MERLAQRVRAEGAAHPVAAALARAARMSVLEGAEDFARRIGIDVAAIHTAESGRLRFGALPAAYDHTFAALELDLLWLAHLEREWECSGPERVPSLA